MFNIYILFSIGIIIGALILYGFNIRCKQEIFNAMFYSGVFGLLLAINGTYTAN